MKTVQTNKLTLTTGLLASLAILTIFLSPLIWLTLTILILAIGIVKKRSIITAIPAAILLTFTYLVCTGGLAGIMHINLYGNPNLTKLALLSFTLLTAFFTIKRHSETKHLKIATKYESIALLPTLLLAITGVRYTLGVPTSWAEKAYNSHDSIAHIIYSTVALQDGAFLNSFDNKGLYPRGLYQIVAMLATATGVTEAKELLYVLLTLTAAIAWLCVVVISGALSLLTFTLVTKMKNNPWIGVILAVVTSLAVNTGPFMFTFFQNGYYTALLALMASAVFMLEMQYFNKFYIQTIGIVAASVFLAANSWQLIGVILGIVTVPLSAFAVKQYFHNKTIWNTVSILTTTLILILATIPILTVAIVRAGDIGTGTGPVSTVTYIPVTLVLLGLLVILTLSCFKRFQRSLPVFTAAAIPSLIICSSLLLAVKTKSLETYYPNKTLFMGLLLAMPIAMAAVGAVMVSLKGHKITNFIEKTPIIRIVVPIALIFVVIVIIRFLLFFSLFGFVDLQENKISQQVTTGATIVNIEQADAIFNIEKRKIYSEKSINASLQKGYGVLVDDYTAFLLGYYILREGTTAIEDKDLNQDGRMDLPTGVKLSKESINSAECEALATKPLVKIFYNPIENFNPATLPCPSILKNIMWINVTTGEYTKEPLVPTS